jgi:hypothetical protein
MPTGARTATRVRKPKVTKLSPPSTAPAAELPMRGLIILPRQAFEQGRGWTTYEGWDVYVLASSRVGNPPRPYADGDVVATDLLKIDGVDWEVDGPPAPFDKGTMRKATLIRVKRVGT